MFYEWPLVVLEGIARQRARRLPRKPRSRRSFSIAVKGGSIIVKDNGPGIPAKTIKGILDYSIRVRRGKPTAAQRAARRAMRSRPSCRWPTCSDDTATMPPARPSSRRTASRITSASRVDHIKQEPKIEHTTKPSTVVYGTRITVKLPPN